MKKKTGRQRLIGVLRWLEGAALPVLFWVSLIYGFDEPCVAGLTIAAALLHELGHLFALLLMGESGSLRGHISGFRIKKEMGYKRELLLLAAGPFTNLGLALALMPLSGVGGGYIGLFSEINLLSGITSLAPIEGYDGYGIIKRLLALSGSLHRESVLSALSFTISCALVFLSLYLMLRAGGGWWLFGVFSGIVFMKIKRIINPGQNFDLRQQNARKCEK